MMVVAIKNSGANYLGAETFYPVKYFLNLAKKINPKYCKI